MYPYSASYTGHMSVMREELHHLVDQLPEERLTPVLQLIRQETAAGRRERALATLERVQRRMQGVIAEREGSARSRIMSGIRGEVSDAGQRI
jgi:hypothetical protein